MELVGNADVDLLTKFAPRDGRAVIDAAIVLSLLGAFYFVGYLRGTQDERSSWLRRRDPGD